MKLPLLLIALAALATPAWSQTPSSVSTLTVAQDAYLQGGTYFGSLIDNQGGPGFKIDVQQTSSTVQQVVYVPETTVETTAWVDVYDWVDMGYWQDEYESYEVEYWVDPVYDENGNEIEPGYPNTTTEYNWVGSSYYSDWQWAVVDSQPTMVSETIPPHEELQYVEEYSTPTIRHTANRTNTAWLWRNPSAVQTGAYRDLMKLTPAGLSFPAPYVTGWARRTLLNDKSFTLSETNEVENDDERQSFGTEITLDGIEVWGEQNGALTDIDRISNPTERRSAKLEESKLTLSTTTLDPVSGSGITMTTQVQAGYANFGGIVEVQGVLRVRPAGDLSMGQFTNGTAP